MNLENEMWQPIETAPKDGTAVDLWVEAVDCSFRGPDFIWRDGEWYGRNSEEPLHRHYGNTGVKATYWMPIPPPPNAGVKRRRSRPP